MCSSLPKFAIQTNSITRRKITLVSKIRVWCPGATYHITARGNRKEDIFKSREDRLMYLSIIEDTLKRYKNSYEIMCYCLMTNHIHLLIKTLDLHPSYFMGRTNSLYAKYFNNKYEYVGHLFQGRYHSELITNITQLLVTSQYIHLNPVRANIVSKPEEYEWSSYKMYIGWQKEKLVVTKEILSFFKDRSRISYREYVEEGAPGARDICQNE